MKTNNLKYSTTIVKNNGENLVISIRLNDECKNGHQDFSITADLYKGTARGDRNLISCGCLHDEINKFAPKFKQFVNLHLSDCNGVPIYVIANGFYHMKEGFNDKTKDHKTQFCNYYRVTSSQYDELKRAKDQNYFGFQIAKLGLLEQWKKEADEAIKKLEELTGDEFINDSLKSQFNLSDEELNSIKEKEESGFYTDEAIEQREVKKAIDKKAELLDKLKANFEAKSLELLQDYEIDKIGINLFLTTSNIIFYKHTNTIVLNWNKNSYDKQYNETEFKQFLDVAKENEYLKDCIFELK